MTATQAVALSIRHTWPDIARQAARMRKDIADRATVRALNTTIRQAEKSMAQEISKTYRLRQADVRDRLVINLARNKVGAPIVEVSLEATRKSKGRSMNVVAFLSGGGRTLKSGKRQQLRFQIRRTGGRKQITGAFVGNGGRTVFIREGKGRLPIKAVSTIDVQQMFNAKAVSTAVQAEIRARFPANWERELRVVLQGYAR